MLPREAVLVLDDVPADICMFLGADVVNYAWKLYNQLKEGVLVGSGGMKVGSLNV